jgi:Outer membrane protein beta-barrel domain
MRRPVHSSLLRHSLLSLTLTSLLWHHAAAQQSPTATRVRVIPTIGYLVFGNYFSGPGSLEFSNQNGPTYGGELELTLGRRFSVIGSALHATSDWSFRGVPLLGTVAVGGASLWFYDAGLRVRFPLGASGRVSPYIQASAGAARYAVNNVLLSDHATNVAFSGGAGVLAQLGGRLSLQGMVKDYLASFKSVDQGLVVGIEGRRAHTLAFLLGAGVGF